MFKKAAFHSDRMLGGRVADEPLEESDQKGDSIIIFNTWKVAVPLAEHVEL
jgi:hypothetical protein